MEGVLVGGEERGMGRGAKFDTKVKVCSCNQLFHSTLEGATFDTKYKGMHLYSAVSLHSTFSNLD